MSEHHHHNHNTGTSGTASVVLDVGAGTGAIAIYTGPERLGQEIEVSRDGGVDSDVGRAGGGSARTHAAVRAREVRPHTLYAALIPDLPAGRYVVWADADTPLDTVTVTSGAVTEYRFPD